MPDAVSRIEDEIRQTKGLEEMAAAADLPDGPPRKNILDSNNHTDAPHADIVTVVDIDVVVSISITIDSVHTDESPLPPPPVLSHVDTPHVDSD